MNKAKNKRQRNIDWRSVFSPGSLIQMVFGVSLAVFALKGFMIPNHFLDGGVTGVSLLLHELFEWNFALSLLLLNAIFIFIS